MSNNVTLEGNTINLCNTTFKFNYHLKKKKIKSKVSRQFKNAYLIAFKYNKLNFSLSEDEEMNKFKYLK